MKETIDDFKLADEESGTYFIQEPTLERLLKNQEYAEKYISMRKDDMCGTLYQGYEKYVQLKERLKNYKTCDKRVNDFIQKILESKND